MDGNPITEEVSSFFKLSYCSCLGEAMNGITFKQTDRVCLTILSILCRLMLAAGDLSLLSPPLITMDQTKGGIFYGFAVAEREGFIRRHKSLLAGSDCFFV